MTSSVNLDKLSCHSPTRGPVSSGVMPIQSSRSPLQLPLNVNSSLMSPMPVLSGDDGLDDMSVRMPYFPRTPNGMDSMGVIDIDPNFEPQTRVRSNTWPLPRPDNFLDKDDCSDQGNDGTMGIAMGMTMLDSNGKYTHDPSQGVCLGPAGQLSKKNSSRRNAWGNMSYADLITQAIHSSTEKRLTLSQIYEWMVQNVPYFKDKGDSNSSAGWKNSIRHNLSLHSRFMRVQNEGTGKSSWWMLNPDAKPGKAARRRAASMETSKYEKKRGRVKKKVDALRAALEGTTPPSPSSSVSESLDMFPESPLQHSNSTGGFQLSPDFRTRASSNASSCGRLSPIPAENDVLSRSPLSPWGSQSTLSSYHATMDRYNTDQLVDSLSDSIKLSVSTGSDGNGSNGGSNQPLPPPPYPGRNGQRPNGYNVHYNSFGGVDYNEQGERNHNQLSVYNITTLQALSPSHSVNSTSPTATSIQSPMSTPPPIIPPPQYSNPTSIQHSNDMGNDYMNYNGNHRPQLQHNSRHMLMNHQVTGQHYNTVAVHQALLRHALQQKDLQPTTMMGQLAALNNGIPSELDVSLETLQVGGEIWGGLECDVDQVIKHELAVEDGNLDFNFPDAAGSTHGGQHVTSANMPTTLTSSTGHHW